MDEIPALREKAVLFALMMHGYLANREEVEVSEIYLEFNEKGYYTLSTWGAYLGVQQTENLGRLFAAVSGPGLRKEL